MLTSSIGDQSASLFLRKQLGELRTQISEVGTRVSTGEQSEKDMSRSGTLKSVFQIDKDLKNTELYLQTIDESRLALDVKQVSLNTIRERSSSFSLGVLSALGSSTMKSAIAISAEASDALKSIVSLLNQTVSGKSLFAGDALNRAAISGSDQIISDVEAIITSSPDASSALASVEQYFNDPAGGFATSVYTGSVNDGPNRRISHDRELSNVLKANDPAIREVIKNLALTAAVSKGAGANENDKRLFLEHAANQNLATTEKLIGLERQTGELQEELERTSALLTAQRHSLQTARNSFVSVNLLEEASVFEELQVQIETSYSVMIKISKLSLSNYIR